MHAENHHPFISEREMQEKNHCTRNKNRRIFLKNRKNNGFYAVWSTGLLEVNKMLREYEAHFVQKAGIAVLLVKIAKKC